MARKKAEIVYAGVHVFCEKTSCVYNKVKQCNKDVIALGLHDDSTNCGSFKWELDINMSKGDK